MNTGRKQVDQRTNAAPAIAATMATPVPTTALMLMPNSLLDALEASLAEVAPLLALPLAELGGAGPSSGILTIPEGFFKIK